MKQLLEGRHPSTVAVAQFFTFDHLAPGLPRDVSQAFARHAELLLRFLPDSPELTAGLRKLLEAKDCAVRAAVRVPRTEGEGGR